MQHIEGLERMTLHLVRSYAIRTVHFVADLHMGLSTGARFIWTLYRVLRLSSQSTFERSRMPRLVCHAIYFVFRDPRFRKLDGCFVRPQGIELPFRIFEQAAVCIRVEKHVPFLVARKRLLGEVRAADDDRRKPRLIEEVPFRVVFSLVDTCLDVGVFEQRAQGARVVEVQVCRGQDPARYAPPPQLEQDGDERLNSAVGDERNREIKADAFPELSLQDRQDVRARLFVVRENSRSIPVIGLGVCFDEARFEAFRKIDDAVGNAVLHGALRFSSVRHHRRNRGLLQDRLR